MLSIVILYFVANPIYKLAQAHDRNKWGYVVLSIGVYFAAASVGAAGMFIFFELMGTVDSIDDRAVGYMGIPFGGLAAWGLYHFLKKRWTRSEGGGLGNDMLDADLMN